MNRAEPREATASALRIGVDARSLLCREPRGEGKTLLRLYSEILALQPGTEVLLFGDERADRFSGQLPAGMRVVRGTLPGDRWNSWENVLLPWLLWRHRCHLLHAASSGAPRWSPVPVLMTVHDLIPLLFEDGQDARLKARFRRRLENGLGSARRVIAVSNHTRTDLLTTFPQVRTPVDVVHWGSDAAAGAAPLRLPAAPYVLAFGGESRRKNTDYTLARFMAVAPQVPALRLVLTGMSAPGQFERVSKRMAAAGLESRVDVPGFVSEAELDALICGASVVLYLSLYEGFGLPLLEAIARGVPVLASDCSSIPEVLRGAPGCFSLDDPSAIEATLAALVLDPALRAEWVERQRAVLPRFTWRDTATCSLASMRAALAG